MNAKNISNPKTFIDYQKLEVGKSVVKYSSAWIADAESKQDKYLRQNPRATNVPHFLSFNKSEYWNEYQYSDYYISHGMVTVYTAMPFGATQYNCYYQESYPLMKWMLTNDHATMLGYPCQKATCTFRGRSYVAWFAPDIPVHYGPWKFGGLPGLILKVYDVNKLYTFECTKIERKAHNIVRRSFKGYKKRERPTVLKLVRRLNENYDNAVGAVTKDRKGNIIKMGKKYYQPLELN